MESDNIIDLVAADGLDGTETGIPASELNDGDLIRELKHLHETRHEVFLHGPTSALQHHSERTTELELEYLRRNPAREIQPRGTDAGPG